MKTAQEWIDQLRLTNCNSVDWLTAIQQDAYHAGLLRAAQVCRVSHPSGYSNWEIMRENVALAIEAEAQKGGQ